MATVLGSGVRLGLVAGGAILLVALTWAGTRARIAAEEQRIALARVLEVLPEGPFDNEVTADRIEVGPNPQLGIDGPHRVFRARRDGALVAIAAEVTAPDGYSGPIALLVGMTPDGRITGVRVTDHRETPGLGDGIEVRVSDWIDGFRDRRLGDPPTAQWTVRSEGGAFDQFTGATITPRAVVHAVRRALDWVAAADPDALAQEP
ncbi:MAG: electron transport complex subunit RsxG [Pseudomonadota bacterium]